MKSVHLRISRMLGGLAVCLLASASHADELLLSPEQRALPTEGEVLRSIGDRSDIIWEREIPVRMRDGVSLSTDVIRLRSAQGRLPTVLLRTPYLKTGSLVYERHPPRYLLQEGYAIVIQYERGTGWSDGEFRFLGGAKSDGYDTLTWIESQPWSNGRVGMVGCSSLAENQLALATMGHPALKALIAEAPAAGIGAIPGVTSQGTFYRGGVPALESWMDWYLVGNGHRYRPKLPAGIPQEERARIAEWYSPFIAASLVPGRSDAVAARLRAAAETLPSKDVASGLGFPQTELDKLITLAPSDAYWNTIDFIRGDAKVKVPALYVGTWIDDGTFDLVQLYKHVSSEPDQHLILSPTSHCRHRTATRHTYAGSRYVGDARLDFEKLYLAWFDRWLKEKDDPAGHPPPVQLYMLGANEWMSGERWPVRPVSVGSWYLSSTASAASSSGGGVLSTMKPKSPRADLFVSDPLRPVDFAPAQCCGSSIMTDQSDVERRGDVLVYTSAPLTQGVAISGEIGVKLYVSTDVKDTDLAVKLVDVYPGGGPAYNVTDTILRLRYRDGFYRARLMQPGKVYEVSFEPMVASVYFPPGHRIRLDVAGTNFPNYERNMNTGGNNYDESRPLSARITLHSGPHHPSRMELPVIDHAVPR